MKTIYLTYRKALIGILIILSAGLFTGCFEGFGGSERGPLLQYLPADALKDLTENPEPDIFIIDVRPVAAYNLGHIPTALSFPSGEIMSRLDEIPLDDPDNNYLILYCESGIRAQAVVNLLIDEGYTKIMNWGSVARWTYPLE